MPENADANMGLSLYMNRLIWLIRVRWVMLITFLALAALLSYWKIITSLDTMACAVVVLGILNLLFFKSLHHEPILARLGVHILCLIQIVTDILAILFLVHLAGGLANPFIFFLAAPIFISGIFFRARWTYVLAILALGGAALFGLFEARGWIEHHPLTLLHEPVEAELLHQRMTTHLVALGWVLLTCAYLSSQVMGALKKREWYLRRLQGALQVQQRERTKGFGQRRSALNGLAEGVEREVKNPLGIIRARVDSMHYGLEDLEQEDGSLAQDLRIISEKVDQIEKTVGKITTVFEQSAGKWESLDLIRILQDSSQAMRDRFGAQGIDFRFLEPDRLLPISGNGQELKKLFHLILQNALEAVDGMGKGKISLHVRALAADPRLVVVRVRDNGPGIPPEMQKQIFDPFYSTRGRDQGLGLPRAYTIARNHGGELRLRSRPPPGTVVLVLLPLSVSGSGRSAHLP